jgi:hypothetical protein
MAVEHEARLDAVFEPDLGARQHQREASRGIQRALGPLVGLARKAAILHLHPCRSSPRGANRHSTSVGSSGPSHSMRTRRSGSIALTATSVPTPYISQSQRTRAPGSSRPLPLENQKREVIAGSTNASNTGPIGRRISIPAFATGAASVTSRAPEAARRFQAASSCSTTRRPNPGGRWRPSRIPAQARYA